VFLAFDLAAGRTAGIIATLVAVLAYVAFWIVIPLRVHPQVGRR